MSSWATGATPGSRPWSQRPAPSCFVFDECCYCSAFCTAAGGCSARPRSARRTPPAGRGANCDTSDRQLVTCSPAICCGVLEGSSVRQVRRDPRRPERVAARRGRQPRSRGPPLDHRENGRAPPSAHRARPPRRRRRGPRLPGGAPGRRAACRPSRGASTTPGSPARSTERSARSRCLLLSPGQHRTEGIGRSVAAEAPGQVDVEGAEVDVAHALEELGGPGVGEGLGELVAPRFGTGGPSGARPSGRARRRRSRPRGGQGCRLDETGRDGDGLQGRPQNPVAAHVRRREPAAFQRTFCWSRENRRCRRWREPAARPRGSCSGGPQARHR